MSRKSWIWLLAVALVLVSLIAWRFKARAADETQLKQGQATRGGRGPANVVTVIASGRSIDKVLDVVGSVESPYNVRLSPRIAGRIETLALREGDAVKQGQEVFTMDQSELQAAVIQAQANAAEARSRLAQARINQAPNEVGIRSGVRQQSANLTSTRADLNQVRNNFAAQVAAAESAVTDADARVASAEAQLQSAMADVESANANLDNLKARSTRTEDLYKQGFIAAQDVDDAKTAVKVGQSAVVVAQRRLDAAKSSVASAKAQRNAAANQLSITKRKGQADIAASLAKVTQAEASLDVASANRAGTPAYLENLAALGASVSAAEAQVRQAQTRLSDAVVRSPIDGTVTERSSDPGAIASPGSAVLTVQFLKWVYVTGSVPIESSADVAVGMPVQITLDAVPGVTIDGRISEVNPSADPANRQFTVRAKVDNPKSLLHPGMFARIKLVLSRTDAKVVVPREAVRLSKKVKVVYVVDDKNVLHERPVETGAEDAVGIEITSGLEPGEKVVTLSYQPLKDGQSIKAGEQGKGKRGNKP